jgi:hypothetical protein
MIAPVQAEAVSRMTPADYLSVATDTKTRQRLKTVLVAIAVPGASVVIAIDSKDWPSASEVVLEYAGCERKSAMEKAKAKKLVAG